MIQLVYVVNRPESTTRIARFERQMGRSLSNLDPKCIAKNCQAKKTYLPDVLEQANNLRSVLQSAMASETNLC